MYSMNLYYVTKLLIDIPGMLLPIYIATTIVYLVVGLQNSFENWILYGNINLIIEFIFTLTALCGYMIGITAGVLCK